MNDKIETLRVERDQAAAALDAAREALNEAKAKVVAAMAKRRDVDYATQRLPRVDFSDLLSEAEFAAGGALAALKQTEETVRLAEERVKRTEREITRAEDEAEREQYIAQLRKANDPELAAYEQSLADLERARQGGERWVVEQAEAAHALARRRLRDRLEQRGLAWEKALLP